MKTSPRSFLRRQEQFERMVVSSISIGEENKGAHGCGKDLERERGTRVGSGEKTCKAKEDIQGKKGKSEYAVRKETKRRMYELRVRERIQNNKNAGQAALNEGA